MRFAFIHGLGLLGISSLSFPSFSFRDVILSHVIVTMVVFVGSTQLHLLELIAVTHIKQHAHWLNQT